MPYNGIPIEPRQNDPGPVLRQTADHTRSGLIYDTAIPLIRPGCAVQTNGTTSDLARHNIRVNAICPGSIKTWSKAFHIRSLGLEPEESYDEFGRDALMKRMGEPSEIAYGALFLASGESSFMTGAHIVIDGGATID